MQIKYNQNPHQRLFHQDSKSKFLLLTSGFGAGKSHGLVMKTLDLSQRNIHLPGGVVVQSIADYKKDLLPLFHDILRDNQVRYKYHQTDHVWSFPWTRAKAYVVSAEKPIRGPNWAYALINEPGLISFERFKETIGRVRLKAAKAPQIALAGTPEGRSQWLYEFFVEQEKPGRRVIYGNTKDNFALHEDYIKTLEESYDSVMIQAYVHGRFVNMNSGAFYYAFSREKNCSDLLKRQPNQEVLVALDFNVEHMTATFWHDDGRTLICFDEIVILNNADTNKMCDAMKARGYGPELCSIYPDPAGNSRRTSGMPDVQILRNNGYQKIYVKPKAPSMRDRQLAVNNLMDKSLVKINPSICKTLLKDWEAVEQNPIDFSKIKDNPKLTHASDGVDYMIDIRRPLAGRKPIIQVMR